MLFDFIPHREAPGVAVVVKGVQVLYLDRVRHRNNLSVRLLEKSAHVGLALASATYDRNVDFLARSNEFRPSQQVAGNQAESCCSHSSGADEFTSRQAWFGHCFLFHNRGKMRAVYLSLALIRGLPLGFRQEQR